MVGSNDGGGARLEFSLFVCEFVVDRTFDLASLLQQLDGGIGTIGKFRVHNQVYDLLRI